MVVCFARASSRARELCMGAGGLSSRGFRASHAVSHRQPSYQHPGWLTFRAGHAHRARERWPRAVWV